MDYLISKLEEIDDKGYKRYKEIKDKYIYPHFTLRVDHIQGDPFAAPSRFSILIANSNHAFPENLWRTPARKTAFEDYLGRQFAKYARKICKAQRGTGKGGTISIATDGQKILKRNAALVNDEFIELRITVGLPGSGRTILGKDAIEMMVDELPDIIEQSVLYKNMNHDELNHHIETMEDQEALREWLYKKELVAFIADNSILPRSSGIEDTPLVENPVPFTAPDSLACEVKLPNAGTIRGMGIQKGITLLVGGGYHGKSTLLSALENGIYNHIPHDGREKVVSLQNAVKIRSEDGRSVSNLDISPFINNLPFAKDTTSFYTKNASGSTSQAANIIEALHCGAELLFIDEDTSATNFMIRDKRMRTLIQENKEPITPLIGRIRELYTEYNVSTVIVMGGSGDYFDIADSVVMMDSYKPVDVTIKAHEIKSEDSSTPHTYMAGNFSLTSSRKPHTDCLDASSENKDVKISVPEINILLYGKKRINLTNVEQLVNIAQTRTIGLLIYYYMKNYLQSGDNLIDGLTNMLEAVDEKGLDIISPYVVGDLSLPRLYELAAAINRFRCDHW